MNELKKSKTSDKGTVTDCVENGGGNIAEHNSPHTKCCHKSKYLTKYCLQRRDTGTGTGTGTNMYISCEWDERLSVYKVAGDGNCFYRCLSLEFFGTDEHHAMLRTDIVCYMEDNIESLRIYLPSSDMDEYLGDMRNTDVRVGSWATEAEITATAWYFGVCIYVNTKVGSTRRWEL